MGKLDGLINRPQRHQNIVSVIKFKSQLCVFDLLLFSCFCLRRDRTISHEELGRVEETQDSEISIYVEDLW